MHLGLLFAVIIAVAPGYGALAQSRSNWTGCYAGLHASYSWIDGRAHDLPFTSGPLAGQGLAWNTDQDPRDKLSLDGDGSGLGAQAGCDYSLHSSSFVAGIMFDASRLDGDARGTSSIATDTHAEATMDWTATLRGRLGYSFGDILVYGSGGLAWALQELDVSDTDTSVGPGLMHITRNTSSFGWVLGLGVEWRFAKQMSLALDYTHMEFGNETLQGRATAPTAAYPRFDFDDLTTDNVRLFINWRL